MSQENVELVREGFARWNKGDYDFFVGLTAPDIELLSRFGSLTGEPYRGQQGVREWLADLRQSFERFDPWLDDVRELGDDVLAIGGINLRARGSGLDMKESMGWVVEFRDGRFGANAVLCAPGRRPRSCGAAGAAFARAKCLRGM